MSVGRFVVTKPPCARLKTAATTTNTSRRARGETAVDKTEVKEAIANACLSTTWCAFTGRKKNAGKMPEKKQKKQKKLLHFFFSVGFSAVFFFFHQIGLEA